MSEQLAGEKKGPIDGLKEFHQRKVQESRAGVGLGTDTYFIVAGILGEAAALFFCWRLPSYSEKALAISAGVSFVGFMTGFCSTKRSRWWNVGLFAINVILLVAAVRAS
jgi:hypothetical protein